MTNPFQEIEKLLQNESADREESLHALMSTVFLQCCDECNTNLRSAEFLETFEKMLKEMKLCRKLNDRSAA